MLRRSCGAPHQHKRGHAARLTAARAQPRTQSARQAVEEDAPAYAGESFYDVLGVSCTADSKTIKRAYLSVVKECHPDWSAESWDQANDHCSIINEIYEVLSDPARRATYDAVFGFALDAVNPFVDAPAHTRDQVFVDEYTCIGCTNCNSVCPNTFGMVEDLWGRARVMHQGADTPEKQQEAIDTCPVSCIHWVSAPQLTLLEAAMARMERVAVWSMGMSGAGSGKDVFTEASLAWHRRQSELRERRAAAFAVDNAQRNGGKTGGAPWSGWWNNVVSFEGAGGSAFYQQAAKQRAQQQAARNAAGGGADPSATTSGSDEDWEGSAPPPPLTDRQAKSISALAARAARASRTWKVKQAAAARGRQRLQLGATSSVSSMDSDDAC